MKKMNLILGTVGAATVGAVTTGAAMILFRKNKKLAEEAAEKNECLSEDSIKTVERNKKIGIGLASVGAAAAALTIVAAGAYIATDDESQETENNTREFIGIEIESISLEDKIQEDINELLEENEDLMDN